MGCSLEGYDGVAYRSSLNENGYNITLFDPQKVKCFDCRMYKIKKITYDFEESGNPIKLSDDGKVSCSRIVGVRPIDSDKRKKKEANNVNPHNKANPADAKSRSAD